MNRPQHVPLFVALGAFYWLVALLFVRLAGEAVFTPGNPLLVLLFAASVPIAIALAWLSSAISRVPMQAMFAPVVIMTFTAQLLDGFVFAFLPWLYSAAPEQAVRGAGWILWGAALGLVYGWWYSRRAMVTEAGTTHAMAVRSTFG